MFYVTTDLFKYGKHTLECYILSYWHIVRRGVKTSPFQKQPPPFWVTPPFLKIPEPPPPPPTFKVKFSCDLKFYS